MCGGDKEENISGFEMRTSSVIHNACIISYDFVLNLLHFFWEIFWRQHQGFLSMLRGRTSSLSERVLYQLQEKQQQAETWEL